MISPRRFAAFFLLAQLMVASDAGLPPKAELVPLKNGINRMELGRDHFMIVLAHRENFNAHSFEIASIFIQTAALESDPKQWQIVPVWREEEEPRWANAIEISGGADCQVHTFRLLKDSASKAAYLLIADREMGESYAAPGPVTFSYYRLTFNPDGGSGEPVAYFKLFQTEKAKKDYCDVDLALKAELNLEGVIASKE